MSKARYLPFYACMRTIGTEQRCMITDLFVPSGYASTPCLLMYARTLLMFKSKISHTNGLSTRSDCGAIRPYVADDSDVCVACSEMKPADNCLSIGSPKLSVCFAYLRLLMQSVRFDLLFLSAFLTRFGVFALMGVLRAACELTVEALLA